MRHGLNINQHPVRRARQRRGSGGRQSLKYYRKPKTFL